MSPCTDIFVSVSVNIGALALLLTGLEVTLVEVRVSKSQLALSFEQILLKSAFVSLLSLSEVLHTYIYEAE